MWLWSCKIILAMGFLTALSYSARAQETPETTPAPLPVATPTTRSLVVHLALTATQREQMDREYTRFVGVLQKQDARISVWQAELRTAQTSITFDEAIATRRTKDILQAQQTVLTAFLRMRGAALRILMPAQRAQLESISVSNTPIADDMYRLLLLLRAEQLGQPAPDAVPLVPPGPIATASTPTTAQTLYPPLAYQSQNPRSYVVRVVPYSGFSTGFFIGRPLSGFNSHLHIPSATLSRPHLISGGHHTVHHVGGQHGIGSHHSVTMSHNGQGQHHGGHHRRH